jgi:hypothetical protein
MGNPSTSASPVEKGNGNKCRLDAGPSAIREMGGHVAKKLGDGLMCLFGYPLAERCRTRGTRSAFDPASIGGFQSQERGNGEA